ncbi:YceI family protein [Galbibacter sp.]|uniref:YceI family protein n=1 Tax=Galbibacter sp. TaxID=2918471 RepID=UPI002D1A6E15|nr:YceI family protein [Galbibacter sp.]HLV64041.1 YceI family protein [Galbibacter sp.]
MKKRILNSVVVLAVAMGASAFVDVVTKEVNVKQSQVHWKGYKVTGSHYGTIDLKSGFLEFQADVLTGGEFIVDMNSINTTDLSGEYKDQLDGHLKSDDFFGVEKYPTATLKITKVTASGKNSYDATGDLTIKGKTLPVDFEISVYGSKATANLKIDRSKYNIRYGSGSFFDNLGDKTIYDEFDLNVDLVF